MPIMESAQPGQRTFPAAVGSKNNGSEPAPLWLMAGIHFVGFGVWFCWVLIVIYLHHVGVGLSFTELFSLLAISGLAAGCVGLTLGFGVSSDPQQPMLGWCLLSLLIPALGLSWLLAQAVPLLWQLQLLALLNGAGAGGCSVLVHRLGLSGGEDRTALLMAVGHWGIVLGFLLLPLLLLLPLSGQGAVTVLWSSHFFARLAPGTELWLAWIGIFWSGFIALLVVLWAIQQRRNWRQFGFSALAFGRAFFTGLMLAAVGAWAILPAEAGGSGLAPPKELLLLAVAAAALFFTSYSASNGERQNALLHLRRTDAWVLSLLWVMSQGSFLGLAAAFPLTVERLFVGAAAPGYPGVFIYAWMLPMLGILVRPLGTWGAARWGGALTTQMCILVLVVAAAGAAYWVAQAQGSTQPTQYFAGFMLAFALLFVAAGVAQSALVTVVQAIGSLRAWMWLSAMAAFGVFYICLALAEKLERGEGVQAMAGFAIFYALCAVVNSWFYLRGSKSTKPFKHRPVQ